MDALRVLVSPLGSPKVTDRTEGARRNGSSAGRKERRVAALTGRGLFTRKRSRRTWATRLIAVRRLEEARTTAFAQEAVRIDARAGRTLAAGEGVVGEREQTRGTRKTGVGTVGGFPGRVLKLARTAVLSAGQPDGTDEQDRDARDARTRRHEGARRERRRRRGRTRSTREGELRGER
ncbi:proprotein convertase subtilisin/kexin type 5 [Gracilaria domingensis]|nr:proprotein convertase subtilisin/kexin type 5 [Gracilaria domingensis]